MMLLSVSEKRSDNPSFFSLLPFPDPDTVSADLLFSVSAANLSLIHIYIPEIIRFHEENLLSGPGGFSVSQVHMQDLYSHTHTSL